MRGGQRLGAGRRPEPNPRRAIVQVRLTEEELASVRETAAHHGVSTSTLIRAALGLGG
jgi:predicted DNA binding CopG/RHH family protein